VIYLTIVYGSFPWIALVLALTFGFYGLLRKTGSLKSAEGLTLETAFYFIPAVAYLLFVNASGSGSFANGDPRTTILLVGTGIVTGVPLILFGAAAKRITMTNLGLLQYIAPTLQFLLGVFVYQEEFSQARLIGFAIIWSALIVYSIESLRHSRGKVSSQTLIETAVSD
jgi:chloramphenicol-sensitive protein RarD